MLYTKRIRAWAARALLQFEDSISFTESFWDGASGSPPTGKRTGASRAKLGHAEPAEAVRWASSLSPVQYEYTSSANLAREYEHEYSVYTKLKCCVYYVLFQNSKQNTRPTYYRDDLSLVPSCLLCGARLHTFVCCALRWVP